MILMFVCLCEVFGCLFFVHVGVFYVYLYIYILVFLCVFVHVFMFVSSLICITLKCLYEYLRNTFMKGSHDNLKAVEVSEGKPVNICTLPEG